MLKSLIRRAARKAHKKGHRLSRFKVGHEGAVSCCKLCDNHVRVTTLNGGWMFGKALDSCPVGAERGAK